jgi:hypothetical protein
MHNLYEQVLVDISKAYLSQSDIKDSVLVFRSSNFDIYLSIHPSLQPFIYTEILEPLNVYTPQRSDVNKPYSDDITKIYLHYRIGSIYECKEIYVSDEHGKLSWTHLTTQVRQLVLELHQTYFKTMMI